MVFYRNKFFSAILACVLCFGCATVPISGRKQLSILPQSEILEMSAQSYRQLLSKVRLSQDQSRRDMVNKVGRDIANAAEQFLKESGQANALKDYAWEFNLIDDDKTVNAFAMPGGKIAVYSGILPLTRDRGGLAVVLAHEVAHVIANHGAERLSQIFLAEQGSRMIGFFFKDSKQATRETVDLVYGLTANLGIVLPYSRKHETEADSIGLMLMARAGYDPEQAIDFWQRMNGAGARMPEFLSTHPAPQTRIESLRAMLPQARQYYKP